MLDLIGFLAGITSAVSLWPQLLRVYRRKSAKDLSWGSLGLYVVTSCLWIIYGYGMHALFVWTTNSVLLVCAVGLCFMKLIYARHV